MTNKIEKLSQESKDALTNAISNIKSNTALNERIAQVFPNVNNDSRIRSAANTRSPADTGTGDSPTSTGPSERSGNQEPSQGRPSDGNRNSDESPATGTSERNDNRTEFRNPGTTTGNAIGTVTINRVGNPASGENSRGADSRRTDGRENIGSTGQSATANKPLAVDIDTPKTRTRIKKADPIDIDVVTFGLQALFAGIGTLAGPHWAITEDAAKSIAVPLKKCLDKLPPSAAQKFEKYADPFAVVVATTIVLATPIQTELFIAKGQLRRGDLLSTTPPPPAPLTETEKHVQSPISPPTRSNGTGKSSIFSDRFARVSDISGIKQT